MIKLQDKKPIFIAVIMMIAAQIGTNFYLVALPSVAKYFSVSSSVALNTVYYYLIPYGLSQIFIAPYVNSIGFKNSALIGFTVFLIGAIIILNATNIYYFAFGRIVQGVGGATIYVIIRMLIQKSYQEVESNIAFSIVESFAMATPIIAPIFGVFLLSYLPWQGLFWFMLTYACCAMFLVKKFMPHHKKPAPPKIKKIFLNYLELSQNFAYTRFLLVALFCFSPIIMSIYSLPFILQETYGLSPASYSFLASLTIVGSFAGTLFSKWANERGQKNNALSVATILMILSGILLQILYILKLDYVEFFMFILMSVFFSYGVIFPNAVADAFKQVKIKTGGEVALLGFFQVAGGSILNFTITRFFENSEKALFLIFIISGISIKLLYKKVR